MALRQNVAILLSGRGSNMDALIAAAQEADYPAHVVLVLSNRPDSAGLVRATTRGIPTACLPHRDFQGDRLAHETAVQAVLLRHGINFVCLAGYMRLLTHFLVDHWQGRMLNVHPSLLPAFPGLNTHARALAAGVRFHGCTVHLVTDAMDQGPILAQAVVPVLPEDDEATLAERVLRQEHIIYPMALRLLASGQAGAMPDRQLAFVSPLP